MKFIGLSRLILDSDAEVQIVNFLDAIYSKINCPSSKIFRSIQVYVKSFSFIRVPIFLAMQITLDKILINSIYTLSSLLCSSSHQRLVRINDVKDNANKYINFADMHAYMNIIIVLSQTSPT